MRNMLFIALSLILPSAALAERPTVADAKNAVDLVKTLSEHSVDPDDLPTLLLSACEENTACAMGCEKVFHAAARATPADRGALLAACDSIDYRARWDKGDKVNPSVWIAQHWHQVLDQLAPLVAKPERASFAANRKKLKL